MCLANRRHFDRKTRLIYSAGNLCLFTGFALTQFGALWGVRHQVLFHGLRGFLVGFSITLLLWVVLRKGSCAQPGGSA